MVVKWWRKFGCSTALGQNKASSLTCSWDAESTNHESISQNKVIKRIWCEPSLTHSLIVLLANADDPENFQRSKLLNRSKRTTNIVKLIQDLWIQHWVFDLMNKSIRSKTQSFKRYHLQLRSTVGIGTFRNCSFRNP